MEKKVDWLTYELWDFPHDTILEEYKYNTYKKPSAEKATPLSALDTKKK